MYMRLTVPLLLCTLLAGCDLVSAISTPVEEKINRAFPLPQELQVAHKALQEALQSNAPAQKAQAALYARRMNERAQTCTATVSIGRLDTISGIRQKVDNADCFARQDTVLADWIGLQHLALVLAKPPLVPLADLPARTALPDLGEPGGAVATATGANVMVVKSGQRFNVVELPGGKSINAFPVPDLSFKPTLLSANGRVLAVPLGSRNLRLFEVETGAVLWDTQAYAGLLAWLPQQQAALLTQSNTGLPYLLDLGSRRIDAFPWAEKQLAWALPTPTADGKYLLGNNATVALVEFKRQGSRLEAAPVKQWRLPENRSIQTGAIWLANEGKRFIYQTEQDLGWLDLQTDSQGVWAVSALGAQGFTKLDDQQILFSSAGNASSPPTPWALDIRQETVGVVKDADGSAFMSLLPRAGYLTRGGGGMALGSAVTLEDAQPLAQVLATAQRALRSGLPRTAVDAIRRGSPAANATPPASAVKPLLPDVPAHARVSVVGVHDSAASTRVTGGSWRPGGVTVNVQPGTTPLVLVLSSQEPVKWLVHTNGRKIEAVLIAGYQESDVYGTGDTKVLKIGSRAVYKMDSPDYEPLKRDIARYVPNPVQSFQGSYRGQTFSVN